MSEDGNRVDAPWSSRGRYGRSIRRDQDPAILKLYEQAGNGRVNPIGFTADRPALIMTPSRHNPYLQLPLALIAGLAGFFLYERLLSAPAWALVVGSFFWLGAGVIIVMALRRIPSWHRARALVREHLNNHPGKFPQELKWFS